MTSSVYMNNNDEQQSPEHEKNQAQDTKPWYRQFWPWFIISLPASAVIAGITTVIIAFKYDDALVVDNYYKAGLAINQVLTQQEVARELGVTVMVGYNVDAQELFVQLPENIKLTSNILKVRLVHSTQAEKDKTLLLTQDQQTNFVIRVGEIQDGWWNFILEPEDGQWQINQRILFPMQGKQQIQPRF